MSVYAYCVQCADLLFYVFTHCSAGLRPLDQLLGACQEKVERAEKGGKFRTEELLQMVCELTVHPETYVALAEIFDSFAPIPANYMSDDEIEGGYCCSTSDSISFADLL